MLSADEDGMQSRRCILTGLPASLAGIPIAAMLTDPVLARAAAQELEGVTLLLDSGREIAVFLAVPDQRRRLPSNCFTSGGASTTKSKR